MWDGNFIHIGTTKQAQQSLDVAIAIHMRLRAGTISYIASSFRAKEELRSLGSELNSAMRLSPGGSTA
jgi:hypothetical protein